MTNYPSVNEVTMYQARCTTCGVIQDEYGNFSAYGDFQNCLDDVVNNSDWFARWTYIPAPTTDNPRNRIGTLEDLLCPNCQRCEVCNSEHCYEHDGHLVCDEHEDHIFA